MSFLSPGRLAEAASRIMRRFGLGSSELDKLYERGAELVETGRYPEAVEILSRALELAPDDVDVMERRATAYSMLDRDDLAVLDLERAVVLDPASHEVRCGLCAVYSSLDPQKALAHCDRALAEDPDDAPTFNNRSTALSRLGREEEAMRDLDRAVALGPDEPSFRVNRAISLIEAGAFSKAQADLDAASADWPNDARLMLAQSRIALAQGDLKQAKDFTGSVLLKGRNHAEALCMAGLLAFRDGEHDVARKLFDEALAAPEGFAGAMLTPRVRWMALSGRGLARFALGDKEGEADLDGARALKSDAVAIMGRWGLAAKRA